MVFPRSTFKKPSAGGVSRNSYNQFNIDSRGVILNNSLKNSQTNIAGFVAANPNLVTREAQVILNEVNAGAPAVYKVLSKVAGRRADVIIANPSGISCNGCGFINAQQATLTTGVPVFSNGELTGYDVSKGTITLGDFNATDADYASIISRAVEVNGSVHAQELRVTTGINKVDASNTQIQVKNTFAASNTGFFAGC